MVHHIPPRCRTAGVDWERRGRRELLGCTQSKDLDRGRVGIGVQLISGQAILIAEGPEPASRGRQVSAESRGSNDRNTETSSDP